MANDIAAEEQSAGAGSRDSILVVDDEASVRLALRKILEKFGYEVMEAKDGAEAMDVYREADPDAVLMDLYMPGVDGVEAIIRLTAEFPDARLIAMSGGGWQSKGVVLEKMTHLGVAATLEKPFTVRDVVDVVSSVLDKEA